MSAHAGQIAPSLADFEELAAAAWTELPEAFRQAAGDIAIRIEDFADDETLEALGLEDAFELTGLYHGLDLPHRSVMDSGAMSPLVFLYRRPILDEWAARGDVPLGELIAHVLVHEIGHHFGFSDAEMDAILDRA